MVYHFIKTWKEIETDLSSLKNELLYIEEKYKLKIKYLKIIWNDLNHKKEYDISQIKSLIEVYNESKYLNTYQQLLIKGREIKPFESISQGEIYSFYDILIRLFQNFTQQKEIAIQFLEPLVSGKIPDNFAALFYSLQDLLRWESEFLYITDEEFKKIESVLLIKKSPGSTAGGYVSILDAFEKHTITIKNNQPYIEGKQIQGIQVVNNKIFLKGDHYSSFNNARWIEGDKYVAPSIADPFSYFVERGKLSGLKQQQIQKVLGIPCAEAIVSLEIEVFPEQVYLKFEKDTPLKIAISQLQKEQVRKVIKKAQLLAA